MSVAPVQYGPNSPFAPDERQTIQTIYEQVKASDHPEAGALQRTIREQIACLEWLGETLAQYPSPLGEQHLGSRHRGLDTLVETLGQANPANFDFFMPTRALLGRALDMAESNFYRLLRHVCTELLPGEVGRKLREEATRRFQTCLYTMTAEEVLSSVASDRGVERAVRERAVLALAQVWEHRLTYRVADFFPVLEATWRARQRITVVGGTLAGTQEIFGLFQHGCDPQFIDYFARPQPSEDEIAAFREFLFATSSEELRRLEEQMAAGDGGSVQLHERSSPDVRDSTAVFYEFFRTRHLLAAARRLSNLPGPKRTAEAYVMVSYLERMP